MQIKPEKSDSIVILSDASKMSSEGLTLKFPDGFIVHLTPQDISMAIATEAFRKRCQ
jgi:hypothetical protein